MTHQQPPADLVTRHLVTEGSAFSLDACDPRDTGEVPDKKVARRLLEQLLDRLREQQQTLYAQDRWAVLLIFQAMDAAGKDSAIRNVMSGVNPQGCQVFSFKAPSSEELDHDYLWRHARALPERGRIGIFNRSWYEEVLVVRVHGELLARQKLPASLLGDRLWEERFEDIRGFERYLARNGVLIRKFFLHVSKEEQRQRFLDRLTEPEKHWKFSARDVRERRHWSRYMAAYQDAIRATSAPWAPWLVIPADRKWYTRLVIAAAVTDALESLRLAYPHPSPGERHELEAARTELEQEAGSLPSTPR